MTPASTLYLPSLPYSLPERRCLSGATGCTLCGATHLQTYLPGAWRRPRCPRTPHLHLIHPVHPPQGTAKLADFGLATRLAGAPLRSPLDLAATSSSLAFHSLGLGSRGFTPPERLRPLLRTPAGVGAKAAEAAEAAEDETVGAHDVFSLGVLSHLVLCASRPRNGVGPSHGGRSAPSARLASAWGPRARLLARSAAQAAPQSERGASSACRLGAGISEDGET